MCIMRIMNMSDVLCLYHTAVQMPDKLTFTEELPLEWLRTEMYMKAAKMLDRHTNDKNPQYHKISANEYFVLTKEGASKYKKVTKTMVKRYHCKY